MTIRGAIAIMIFVLSSLQHFSHHHHVVRAAFCSNVVSKTTRANNYYRPTCRTNFVVSTTKFFSSSSSSSLSSSSSTVLSKADESFMQQAIEYARIGVGHTFPNPAVGCVLVNQDTNEVIGAGFHPQAGFPHAEIFALLEAAGHVESGVAAATSVVQGGEGGEESSSLMTSIQTLASKYSSDGGPKELFGDLFLDQNKLPVTAYVTLEPCCHYGRTPPCATTFALAKVNRVVIGYRDPNPKVDGGGVQILKEAGIQVDLLADGDSLYTACATLVSGFVKRITPRGDNNDLSSWINGAMRSSLRALANTKKSNGDLAQLSWNGETVKGNEESSVDAVALDPTWMESLDELLWEHELVNLRLNRAVGKKKLARRLGERIAKQLDAHVSQAVGHTVLLYRPSVPPVLDLNQLVLERSSDQMEKE
jgi:pyrimidine deaminase RibD-like protein/RNA-binding protein YhbY